MSWAGFKKAVNRAGTTVMMKTGHIEKTIDQNFDIEERRFSTLEKISSRLIKQSRNYLDTLQSVSTSQCRIAETIDSFYGEKGARNGVQKDYLNAVEEFDGQTINEISEAYNTTVLGPISRFSEYFPDINDAIKKRNHKCLDYDSLRTKVKKYSEKPSEDPTKLKKLEEELSIAKDIYSQINDQVINEIPQLIDLRVPYIQPSFDALVKLQIKFCQEAYLSLLNVQKSLDKDSVEAYASGNLDKHVAQCVKSIHELTNMKAVNIDIESS